MEKYSFERDLLFNKSSKLLYSVEFEIKFCIFYHHTSIIRYRPWKATENDHGTKSDSAEKERKIWRPLTATFIERGMLNSKDNKTLLLAILVILQQKKKLPSLTLLRMGNFGAVHGCCSQMGEGSGVKRPSLKPIPHCHNLDDVSKKKITLSLLKI